MAYNLLRKGRYSEPGREYLVTVVTDTRRPWFTEFQTARCVIGEMRQLHDQGHLESLAWVLMPDHLHWLFALTQTASLAKLLHAFKGRSARRVNQRLDRRGRLWQPSFHDRALRVEEDRINIARYIIANPLRAGLVARVGDYPHWDAVWLSPSGDL